MRSRKTTLRRRLRRIARIPRDLRNPARRGAAIRRLAGLMCAAVIVAGGVYTVFWMQNRARIEREGERYSMMYAPAREESGGEGEGMPASSGETPAPDAAMQTDEAAAPDAGASTAAPSETTAPDAGTSTAMFSETAASDVGASTATPSDAAAPDAGASTAMPSETAASGVGVSEPVVSDVLLPTPDSGTLVLALETPPPVQESFSELLGYNADTVGFLQIGDIVSLPVVQRVNDNEYYLTHTFSGAESAEGALFLDGMNLLVPEDDCLIVYGHNMQNGTMFGDLKLYRELYFLRGCPPVAFDTIYENRLYAPFAVFIASMEAGDASYFDVRQFVFDESDFNAFVSSLRAHSEYDVPIDVRYGDSLLLLVTCDNAEADGRLIVAFRALREDETSESVAALLAQAE